MMVGVVGVVGLVGLVGLVEMVGMVGLVVLAVLVLAVAAPPLPHSPHPALPNLHNNIRRANTHYLHSHLYIPDINSLRVMGLFGFSGMADRRPASDCASESPGGRARRAGDILPIVPGVVGLPSTQLSRHLPTLQARTFGRDAARASKRAGRAGEVRAGERARRAGWQGWGGVGG